MAHHRSVLVAIFLLGGAPVTFAGHEHDLSRPDPIEGIVLADGLFC
jgi:hypothetical protein